MFRSPNDYSKLTNFPVFIEFINFVIILDFLVIPRRLPKWVIIAMYSPWEHNKHIQDNARLFNATWFKYLQETKCSTYGSCSKSEQLWRIIKLKINSVFYWKIDGFKAKQLHTCLLVLAKDNFVQLIWTIEEKNYLITMFIII